MTKKTDDKKKKTRKRAPKKTAKASEKKEAPKPKVAEKPVEKPAAPKAEKAPEKKPEKPKRKRASKKKKPKEKVVVAKGKRKRAVARATVRKGSGVIRINSKNLEAFENEFVKDIIREAVGHTGPDANGVDISVNVYGGGMMGQAQAARTAIALALVTYFDDAGLKEKFVEIDRSLVVNDPRRVEAKKWKGPKARARYQKSYR